MADEPRVTRYRLMPPQVDLPAMEREILALWAREDTFARSVAETADGEPWTFYEGPPTANGMPGVHHVEARVFKDVFPRFKTMQGRHVVRKAGWDCHGLPVEIAIEKELGFNGKRRHRGLRRRGVQRQVPRVGRAPRRRVRGDDRADGLLGRHVPGLPDDGHVLCRERLVVAQADLRRGLLVAGPPRRPYCPRCGTGLSDHELAQGYETVVDPSVYVRSR